jgi:phage terminase small subunit
MAKAPTVRSRGGKARMPKELLVKPTNRKDYDEEPATVRPFKANSAPEKPVLLPPPPKSLRAEGKRRWAEHGASLMRRGLWSLDFAPGLEHLCRLYDQLDAVEKELIDPDTGDESLLVATSWGPKCHPLAASRSFLMGQIRQLLTDFGMTPNSARGAAPASGTKSTAKSSVPRRDRTSSLD